MIDTLLRFITARRYAIAVLAVVTTRALWLIQRTYMRYFLYRMKGQSF